MRFASSRFQNNSLLRHSSRSFPREWHGKKYLVRVLDSGLEFEGKPYRSLSALAKQITGQIVNGYAWFRLGAKEPKKS